jgi:hypothetical protein
MQILKFYGLRPDLKAMTLCIMEVKSTRAHMDFISEGVWPDSNNANGRNIEPGECALARNRPDRIHRLKIALMKALNMGSASERLELC